MHNSSNCFIKIQTANITVNVGLNTQILYIYPCSEFILDGLKKKKNIYIVWFYICLIQLIEWCLYLPSLKNLFKKYQVFLSYLFFSWQSIDLKYIHLQKRGTLMFVSGPLSFGTRKTRLEWHPVPLWLARTPRFLPHFPGSLHLRNPQKTWTLLDRLLPVDLASDDESERVGN